MRGYRSYIDAMTGRFMSEYAASGSPPLRSVRKFMSDADLADPRHVGVSHEGQPAFRQRADAVSRQWNRTPTSSTAAPPSPEQHVRHLEYVQYEFIRLAMESARRRQFDCSGIQFWMFNDCWPAAGWSVLDYWGNRKAGWYGMASGCKAVIASLDLSDERVYRWWVCNGTLEPAAGKARIFVQPWQGSARWEQTLNLVVPANSSKMVAEIPRADLAPLLGLDSVLVCDVGSSIGEDRAWYFAGLPHEMKLPATTLRVTREGDGDRGLITIRTENYGGWSPWRPTRIFRTTTSIFCPARAGPSRGRNRRVLRRKPLLSLVGTQPPLNLELADRPVLATVNICTGIIAGANLIPSLNTKFPLDWSALSIGS